VRVLVVDNYDSFAWNLVQALAALGAEVVVRRNDAVTVDEALSLPPDAVVVSPGPCTPAEAGVSVELVRAAARRGVPLLGVCLGHQAIGAAFGGRVVRARAPVHGKTSEVLHDGRGVLRGLPSPFTAMRYHSLVVEEPLPEGIEATARTASGELMGLRHARLPIEGVQFHPESFMTAAGPSLLANFLEGARAANLGRA
jgi:anthranilate synthase/aminodeoxychorismate synthase-like glutamine amidotransferase